MIPPVRFTYTILNLVLLLTIGAPSFAYEKVTVSPYGVSIEVRCHVLAVLCSPFPAAYVENSIAESSPPKVYLVPSLEVMTKEEKCECFADETSKEYPWAG